MLIFKDFKDNFRGSGPRVNTLFMIAWELGLDWKLWHSPEVSLTICPEPDRNNDHNSMSLWKKHKAEICMKNESLFREGSLIYNQRS